MCVVISQVDRGVLGHGPHGKAMLWPYHNRPRADKAIVREAKPVEAGAQGPEEDD